MTVQFVGHITNLDAHFSGEKLTVRIAPQRSECGQDTISINIPKRDAANWIPGRMVQFTIYTLPEPAKVTP